VAGAGVGKKGSGGITSAGRAALVGDAVARDDGAPGAGVLAAGPATCWSGVTKSGNSTVPPFGTTAVATSPTHATSPAPAMSTSARAMRRRTCAPPSKTVRAVDMPPAWRTPSSGPVAVPCLL